MRARLRALGLKARRNAKALTLDELAEICDLVYALGPEQGDHTTD